MSLPVIICRHYDVKWLNSDTCLCQECGKQGHWTKQGFSIWVRPGARHQATSSQQQLAKAG